MANKDFFDEEFEKLEQESAQRSADYDRPQNVSADTPNNSSNGESFNSWYGYNAPAREKPSARKPLYIALICVALVLCILLGSLLTIIFGGVTKSKQQKLLDKVMQTLERDFYEEVSDETMWEAVEDAGTALLQTGGDRYSRLMSPKTYYEYMNGNTQDVTNPNGEFGMSFQFVASVGMYVIEVKPDSNAYGWLQETDIIVKIDNINNGVGVNLVSDDGGIVNVNSLVTSNCSQELLETVMLATNSATFHVLRNGEIAEYTLARRNMDYVNGDYKFDYVEFYFGQDNTNVSLEKQGSARYSTYEERQLNKLPANTGYIRLTEFAGDRLDPQAYTEFKIAMDKFKELGLKRLVLDLKGNPGGNVDIAKQIAGLLITDDYLTAAEKSKVTSKSGSLLVTKLQFRDGSEQNYYIDSVYDNYFDAKGANCDIVVWTDGGSASASELLTGALLDYKTAVQMGTQTYKKGIAQIVMPLNGYQGTFTVDGQQITEYWYIYYTAAKYYPPLSGNIHGVGYTPEEPYNNLAEYADLWDATKSYFSQSGGGILA